MIANRATTNSEMTKLVQHAFVLVFAVVMSGSMSGCLSGRIMMGRRGGDPMAGSPRLRNFNNPRLEEVVAHLNENTDRLKSWRSDSVTIRASGWKLSGTLAVEKGKRVHLTVNSPMGTEVDLGSNDERFWIWSKRMDPQFVTCRHENMEAARQTLGIPFEPEWLMQALSVAPLPTTGVKLEAAPSNDQMRIEQQVMTAHGRPLRRVVLIDLTKGKGIVLEHSLYDYSGARIAIAKLSAHKYDKNTGVVLPHYVTIDWPQNQMSMKLDLGKIQINPEKIPAQVWRMPEPHDCEIVNLDESIGGRRLAIRPDALPLHKVETKSSTETDEEDETDHDRRGEPAGHARLSLDDDEPPKSDWDK